MFEIAGRKIGRDEPCFVIAEAGVNHDGDVDRALRLVDEACTAGADAVKFQTFRAHLLASPHATKAKYQGHSTESQREMLQRLELDEEAHEILFRHCLESGILFLSSAFDFPSASLLARLGVPALKLGSGEVTDLPLIERISRIGLPVILSTGMATQSEIKLAVESLGSRCPLALLHCVSLYPTPSSLANLRAMHWLEETFEVPVGFSDHTVGWDVSIAAVALGASLLEKHFTLDSSAAGPDHSFSLEPEQLKRMIDDIRSVEAALAENSARPSPEEEEMRKVSRKSLVASRPLDAGTCLKDDDLRASRPGIGISPTDLADVVGRKLRRSLTSGDLLSWGDLQ